MLNLGQHKMLLFPFLLGGSYISHSKGTERAVPGDSNGVKNNKFNPNKREVSPFYVLGESVCKSIAFWSVLGFFLGAQVMTMAKRNLYYPQLLNQLHPFQNWRD